MGLRTLRHSAALDGRANITTISDLPGCPSVALTGDFSLHNTDRARRRLRVGRGGAGLLGDGEP